jgi:hypothetical protein
VGGSYAVAVRNHLVAMFLEMSVVVPELRQSFFSAFEPPAQGLDSFVAAFEGLLVPLQRGHEVTDDFVSPRSRLGELGVPVSNCRL